MSDVSDRGQVLVVEPVHDRGVALLSAAGTVVVASDPSPETVQPLLADATVIVLRATRLTADMIAAAPRLRVVGRHGVGWAWRLLPRDSPRWCPRALPHRT